jgi:hypothetical protein
MLNSKGKIMKVQMSNALPVHEILSSYSGRRLQYAIKIGIIPAPESLSQTLKRKLNARGGFKKRVMA